MKIHTDKKEFGFLSKKFVFEIDSVNIKPLPNFDEISKKVFDESNIDGFYYPPEIIRVEIDPITNKKIKNIPRTTRPASVFYLPPSHSIDVKDTKSIDDPVISHEALFVHALAFLFGTRLQFKEWRFDGRVPIKPINNWILRDEIAIDFLSHVNDFWLSQCTNNRKRIINIFYIHSLARSHENQWNAFIHSYMLTDAIYRFWCDYNAPPTTRVSHSGRIKFLCEKFDIFYSDDEIKFITSIRNELFHESLWAGNLLGYGFADGKYENVHTKLMKLNERLICSVIGYKNEFSRSSWIYYGVNEFDKFIE